MVYNVNMVCRAASHQSLLIFNVHYISLVNVRPRVELRSRLSVSLSLSSLHIKIVQQTRSSPSPTPLFMVNLKWNEEKSLQQSSFFSFHIFSDIKLYSNVNFRSNLRGKLFWSYPSVKISDEILNQNLHFSLLHSHIVWKILHIMIYLWIKISWDSTVVA